MYTSKSVSQRSAICNPEEIRIDRVLFSLDRIFVKACQCRHSSPLGTFCVLRGEDRGFTAHSLIFRSRSSMPIIDVLLFLLEDFHSGEFVKSCIFVPVFKEYVSTAICW